MNLLRQRWPAILLSVGFGAAPALGQTTISPEELFQTRVQSVIQDSCLPCHNDQTATSGLSLTSREALLIGGNRGPAIVPGQSAESLLLRAVEQSGDLKMPMGGKLADDAIAALRQWIDRGAAWTGKLGSSLATAAPKQPRHWAFQPIRRSPIPEVHNTGWVRNPIDNFVLAGLEEENIQPSPEASSYTLVRRLSLDLTGLQPAPEEIHRFANDTSDVAYDRLIERLLASPHYGERWGRHWLDAARYADTNGYTRDGARQIWMYRDWVIGALNRDLPFDQFVIEQVAGDLLPNPTPEQVIATGFHRNTPINLEGGVDFEQYRVEAVADRASTTGQVFLGLTLGCARCHDHKYDPISQREFYQLFAFFNSIAELDGGFSEEEGRKRAFEPILEFGTPEQYTQRDAVRSQLEKLQKELAEYEETLFAKYRDWENAIGAEERAKFTPRVLRALQTPPEKQTEEHRDSLRRIFRRLEPGYKQRLAGIKALEETAPQMPHTLVMGELPEPRPSHVLLGGDFTEKGIQVQPGTPAVLPHISKHGLVPDRLDLARWLVDPGNPLTPRVTVNRLWQRYFGTGLVETEDDFGLRGSPPSHPELLDWLASEFVASGWNLKHVHRLIVTSATYRQSSKHRKDLERIDPKNRLLARQTRLRLEAEIVRDLGLRASGLLEPQIGGPSVFPPQPEAAVDSAADAGPWVADQGKNRYRRGLYTSIRRGSPHTVLLLFDSPDPTISCTRRNRSNTPLQALSLLNDEAFREFAQGFARRVLYGVAGDENERLGYAFRLALGRPPDADEEARLREFLGQQLEYFRAHPDEARTIAGASKADDSHSLAAWIGIGRALMNLDEFITRE